MTARGARAPRTRASHGAVRWARAAVIALSAVLAVLIHHETAAATIGPTSWTTPHLMAPGTAMPGHAQAPAMSGDRPTITSVQDPRPTTVVARRMISVDTAPCSGTTMEHCSTGSLVETVKLPVPERTPTSWALTPYGTVTAGSQAAGTVERAPPDLSVLAQLRI
ncbi:hypothetical protein ACIQNG_26535 [Streptomyces sp. NPDC091377]|uniref:hypothetical protein n=1 Tax=Streptomyces sp. NPDC091377 TaxID=3365995 RepID=UPI0037FB16D7